jgi:hypothetical protein
LKAGSVTGSGAGIRLFGTHVMQGRLMQGRSRLVN